MNRKIKILLAMHGDTVGTIAQAYGCCRNVVWKELCGIRISDLTGNCVITFTTNQGSSVITCDAQGKMDGVGNLIVSPADGLQSLLTDFIGIPVGLLNSTRFATAKTRCTARGYTLAGAIISSVDAFQVLKEFIQSFDANFFEDRGHLFSLELIETDPNVSLGGCAT